MGRAGRRAKAHVLCYVLRFTFYGSRTTFIFTRCHAEKTDEEE